MEAKKIKSIGAWMGNVFIVIVALCLCSLVVAATVKLIMCMF